MRTNLDKVQLRLAPDLLLAIRKLAIYDDRSMSNYISKILKEHVRTNQQLLSEIDT